MASNDFSFENPGSVPDSNPPDGPELKYVRAQADRRSLAREYKYSISLLMQRARMMALNGLVIGCSGMFMATLILDSADSPPNLQSVHWQAATALMVSSALCIFVFMSRALTMISQARHLRELVDAWALEEVRPLPFIRARAENTPLGTNL